MAKKPAAEIVEVAPMLALIDEDAPEGTALVVATAAPPEVIAKRAAAVVLQNPERFDQFYDRVRDRVSDFVPDLTTAAGRKACASKAFEVTKVKTTLDRAALDLTADWRAKTAAVNAARKPMVDRFDQLAAEVRAPLTAWEGAEDARIEANRVTLELISNASTIRDDDTSQTVADRGRYVHAARFLEPQWTPEEAAHAEAVKQVAVAGMVAAFKRMKQDEADKAELAELRAAAEARRVRQEQEAEARDLAPDAVDCQANFDAAADQVDHDIIVRLVAEAELPDDLVTIAAEATAALWADHVTARRVRLEREAEEALQRERDRVAALEAEAAAAQKRLDDAAAEAAAKAKREAEEAAAAEQAKRDADAAAALAQEKARADKLEAEAKAERDAAAERAQVELDRKAKEQREADEQAAADRKRQADKAHRRKVLAEIADDLVTGGVPADVAAGVALVLASDAVRHVTVAF
jgi:hypothetical protein